VELLPVVVEAAAEDANYTFKIYTPH